MNVFRFFILSCLMVLAAATAISGETVEKIPIPETDDFWVGSLPDLQAGEQTHQFCTYDRAGDNYDSEYFPLYNDTNGGCVIFDAMGPGCLYRQQMNIWYGE